MTDERPKHPRRRKRRAKAKERETARMARRADRHASKQQIDQIVRDR